RGQCRSGGPRDIEHIDPAARLQPGGDLAHLLRPEAHDASPRIAREPDADEEIRRHGAGDCGADLLGEPHAIVEGAAVVIFTAVGDGAPELLDEVPAVTGDLDPIPPAAR